MADCEYLEGCPFFCNKIPNMPVLSEFFKELYCRGQYRICARYRVAQRCGQESVPLDLFPNEEERARGILKKGAPGAGAPPAAGA